MIHPSYTELIEAINTNNEDDDTTMSINSRYSLVLAASKRARQLIAGAKPMVAGAAGKKHDGCLARQLCAQNFRLDRRLCKRESAHQRKSCRCGRGYLPPELFGQLE